LATKRILGGYEANKICAFLAIISSATRSRFPWTFHPCHFWPFPPCFCKFTTHLTPDLVSLISACPDFWCGTSLFLFTARDFIPHGIPHPLIPSQKGALSLISGAGLELQNSDFGFWAWTESSYWYGYEINVTEWGTV
jgi:hypothetical protein